MLKYILRRLAQMVPVLFGVSLLAFFSIHLVPGDPIKIMLGSRISQDVLEVAHRQLGLDQPLHVQYINFISKASRGDFGHSILQRAPVTKLIREAMGPTFFLLIYGVFITLLVTFPLAIAAAIHEGRMIDHCIRITTIFCFSMPGFWVGLLLMLLFGLHLNMFPIAGYGKGFWEHLHHMFLPALTITFMMAPILIQSLRAAMLEVMTADYIEVARAKGLGQSRIMVKHVLRNALIPVVTLLAVNIGWLISASVVVEYVFSIYGLGSVLVRSVGMRDYPLVQALCIFFAAMVLVVNLAADLTYMVIDKRVIME
jgi:ABC-type dipeptide/oligopeptide/nickel transport system permease component